MRHTLRIASVVLLASCGGGDNKDPDAAVAVIDGNVAPDACASVPERCNDVDDDCDTLIDEEFADKGMDCDGTDADSCPEGTFVCGPDETITICNDTTDDTPELCDGLDNDDDCDGMDDVAEFMIDEPCDGPGDTDLCLDGMMVCNAEMTGSECSDTTPNQNEICNGVDDDCDVPATIDEGTCSAGVRCDGAAGCECDTSSGCGGCCTAGELCGAGDSLLACGIGGSNCMPCDDVLNDCCEAGVCRCGSGGATCQTPNASHCGPAGTCRCGTGTPCGAATPVCCSVAGQAKVCVDVGDTCP